MFIFSSWDKWRGLTKKRCRADGPDDWLGRLAHRSARRRRADDGYGSLPLGFRLFKMNKSNAVICTAAVTVLFTNTR